MGVVDVHALVAGEVGVVVVGVLSEDVHDGDDDGEGRGEDEVEDEVQVGIGGAFSVTKIFRRAYVSRL